MKIKILPFLIATLMFCSGYGQTTFEKLLDSGDNDIPCGVIQTKDSCFVWAASTDGPTNQSKIFLVKMSEFGDTIWAKTYFDDCPIVLTSLKETKDGSLIMVGGRKINGTNLDYYLLKFTSNGDSIFFKTYGGFAEDIAFDVAEGENSYTMIGGAASYSSHGSYGYNCIYMLTTDLNGDSLWSKTYEPKDYNLAYQIRKLSNGDFVFPSLSNYAGQTSEFCSFILRTDSLGNLKWMKSVIGDTSHIAFNSIGICSNQELIWGGIYQKSDGVRHAILYKTDSNGNALWCKNYFPAQLSAIRAIDINTDGTIAVCGYKSPSLKSTIEPMNFDDPKWYKCFLLLMKVDTLGDTVWTRTFSPAYSNLGRSIKICNDRSLIILADLQNSESSEFDAYLLKTYENGSLAGLQHKETIFDFVLFPNPSSGRLIILCKECCKPNSTYNVINISGIVVQSGHLHSETTQIDIPEKGIYFIEITGSSTRTTEKIIIH